MPQPLFLHDCDGKPRYLLTLGCDDCGQAGDFDGWHLTTHELMARYQYVTGLKPIGPHRGFADQLLAERRTACPRCNWVGVLTVDDGRGWMMCPVCEGTGGFWDQPDEDIEQLRQAILKLFPGAAARAVPAFLRGVVQDLSTGEMTG